MKREMPPARGIAWRLKTLMLYFFIPWAALATIIVALYKLIHLPGELLGPLGGAGFCIVELFGLHFSGWMRTDAAGYKFSRLMFGLGVATLVAILVVFTLLQFSGSGVQAGGPISQSSAS